MLELNWKLYGPQFEFYRDNSRSVAFIGGYGSGKSHTGSRKMVRVALQNPGCVSAIVSPTYRMLKDIMLPRMTDALEIAKIEHEVRLSDMQIDLPWVDHTILLRSCDRPDKIKGLNLCAFLFDEAGQTKKEAHDVLISRVRDPEARVPQMLITSTPEGMGWLYDVCEGQDSRYTVYRMGTRENESLTDAYIEDLVSNYNEQKQRSYLDGEFVDLSSGRVYSEFNRSKHVEEFDFNPRGPLVHAVDFNVDPMCSSLGWMDGGTFFVWDEIHIDGGSNTYALGEEVSRRYADKSVDLIVKGDATGRSRKTSATMSDYRILATEFLSRFGSRFLGVDVPSSNPAVVERINSVGGAFRRDAVRIHPRCRNLIDDLERTVWLKGTRAPDKSDRLRTHHTDALGYWVHKDSPVHVPVEHPTKKPRKIERRSARVSRV